MASLRIVRAPDGLYTVCRGGRPLVFDVPTALARRLADRWSVQAADAEPRQAATVKDRPDEG